MIFAQDPAKPDSLRAAIQRHYRIDEDAWVSELLDHVDLPDDERRRIEGHARHLVEAVRAGRLGRGGVDAFMVEYELSSEEGVALMCLAEALLRIPDTETADRLIRDKIGSGDWAEHRGHSPSLFVNASTWGLMLTGNVIQFGRHKEWNLSAVLGRLVARSGEPFIRQAVRQAMNIMGRQFVLGRTIEEARKRGREMAAKGYRYSYDMLGEGARTDADAQRYFASYAHAIEVAGNESARGGVIEAPGISVKLTALHPRFEIGQMDRVHSELLPRARRLALMAKERNMGFNIDAEEAERLEPTLDVLEALAADPELAGWDGLGIAIQAYQKRALPVVDWLADLGRRTHRRLMVRLVKGAYWDTEIKLAQEKGLDDYPVFTRKANTDVSYLACARRLLAHRDVIYPQFATHNAHTVAAVYALAGDREGYELQRLHGMGEALYEHVLGEDKLDIPVRIYAPVGSHEDLLPYLVRRLLENGANSSFVNRLIDDRTPIDAIIADPVEQVRRRPSKRHPKIPLPRYILGEQRLNSWGVDLSDIVELQRLNASMNAAAAEQWHCAPIISGRSEGGEPSAIVDPSNTERTIGSVINANSEQCGRAMARAARAQPQWDARPAEERAALLEAMADQLEHNRGELMAIAAREGGKGLGDGVAEVREAADFCRYYAARARTDFARPEELPGPTGEHNEFQLHGRGVFVCISPWNFPLAIFTGQVAAALVAGNSVIAKPAEQTPLMAAAAVRSFHQVGVPPDVLHLIPGRGEDVGPALLEDPHLAGVAFTGGFDTAKLIQRQLAERPGAILPLIAETGGQNAMIVDSSALPEQVASDVIKSAFHSAGQRCSALRVLYLQSDVADKIEHMIAGAMAELRLGDPAQIHHDIGPAIDANARAMLEGHTQLMREQTQPLASTPLTEEATGGHFFAPHAFRISSINNLEGEVFGPALHIVRFQADELDDVIDHINGTGYGLTLGIHSRIEETVDYIHSRVRVGNTYVNRDQIGSMVGQQPFGGEGLSGTGPKAGGPHYLHRFATERSLCVDTTAQGGNAGLMAIGEIDPSEETEAPQRALPPRG